MEIVTMENIDELIKAQTQIWNDSLSYIKSMCLKCAVELGIPDAINNHGQPISLSNLVASLPIHPTKTPYVFRLMRILVHSGLFSVDQIDNEERYSLTPTSRLLLKNMSFDSRSFVYFLVDPIFMKPFDCLGAWFKSDDINPFVTSTGETFWEHARHEAKLNELHNECMNSDSALIGKIVVVKCKEVFKGIDSLVDVGGGFGIICRAIVESFPHIKCTVLDQPHVVADLKSTNNLVFVGGDMFQAIPPADAYLFKWTTFDWADEDCLKMLKKCKEGINKKGKIIIIDMVLPNQKSNYDITATQLIFDMVAMACVKGRGRNETDWAKLFTDSGFTNYKIHPVLGFRSLIEVYP